MGQINLIASRAAGRTILWHALWVQSRRSRLGAWVEGYCRQLYGHLAETSLTAAQRAGALRRDERSQVLLLTCHLLRYQEWLLCLLYYVGLGCGRRADVGRSSQQYLWLQWTHIARVGRRPRRRFSR